MEELKNCLLPKDIKVHLEENKVVSLEEAARMADEYMLSHKGWVKSRSPGFIPKYGGSGKYSDGKVVGGKKVPISPGERKDVECFFCHKKGHMRADCYAYKRSLEKGKKSVALVGKVKLGQST